MARKNKGRGKNKQGATRPAEPTPAGDYPALPSLEPSRIQTRQAPTVSTVEALQLPSEEPPKPVAVLQPFSKEPPKPVAALQPPSEKPPKPVAALQSPSEEPPKRSSPSPVEDELCRAMASVQIRRGGHDSTCKPINLVSNFYPVSLPEGFVYHYDVEVSSLSKAALKNATNEKFIRCTSVQINRRVVATLAQAYKQEFKNCLLAYDGRKNMYVRRPLPINDKVFMVDIIDNEVKRQFAVKVKLVNRVSFDVLHSMYAGRSSNDLCQSAIAAADIILRTGPSLIHVSVGRSFFSYPGPSAVNLGGGREAWVGFYSSIRLGKSKPLVNIDMSTTTFYRQMLVIDFAREILGERKLQRSLSERDRWSLQKELAGLRVRHIHLHPKRSYRIDRLSQRGANAETFDCAGQRMTVADYFREKYNVKLQYAYLPCIVEHNGSMLPMEVCLIAPDQHCRKKLTQQQTATLIRSTAVDPRVRFEKIKQAMEKTQEAAKAYLNEFDMKISNQPVSTDASGVEVTGNILRPPRIAFSKNVVLPVDGLWETTEFDVPAKLEKWALAIHGGELNDSESVIRILMNQARRAGMQPSRPVYVKKFLSNCSERAMLEIIKNAVHVDIVLVVLGNTTNYSVLKMEAETSDLCMRTQCVRQAKVNLKFSNAFADNLLLKINSKCGGRNWRILTEDRPDRLKQFYMVVGADVNHPAPGDTSSPSVAALVATVDPTATKFFTTTSAQMKSAEKKRIEHIVNLKTMFEGCLLEFERINNHLPKIIYFYRDGVSEGELPMVRSKELKALMNACNSARPGYRPNLTYIVVQKRHHVRFKPKDERQGARKRNMPSGTVIDHIVTHRVFPDFYLCSHQGPMGTSVPAHYHIVYDDAGHTIEELEKLSYYLCFMFARCSKSVSIPAPVFYAHLAAKRAKEYIKAKCYGGSSSETSSDMGLSLEDFNAALLPRKEMNRQMYFV
ncbi:translation initiation factor 2C-like [Tropilaelaps mercedesae]|uniref:Translation initiation factor 2C-like n=1 Tax=Tropilaelaps mercedesae TaxID=418985 RepID=A0A1V9WYY4_9ACAR|nr:translation initiation factor 2C-like [Tropilaelaps mercedesae]